MEPNAAIRENAARGRFELDVDGQVVFALVRRHGATLVIDHVEAPTALRGMGAAGRLMQGLMGVARREGAKVLPRCGYAAWWIRSHAEHRDLLA
jgi:predicted GNAT family acetyltransferase